MKYRNIFIANKARLYLKNGCMMVDNGEVDSIPLEDIRCVMVENQHATLSAALLAKLAENGVPVVFCNDEHLPSASLYGINSYSRQLKQLNLQMDQTLPTKKRLWSQIVIAKIENQALCLEFLGLVQESEHLRELKKSVKSGDPQNIEGKAAAYYFKALFGKDFKRRTENDVNASLNYGYSIIRSYIARTLSVYGLEPCLGIHHKNELNNFNLVDDLLEPFRPIVDLYTATYLGRTGDFTVAYRARLFTILNMDILSKKEKCTINIAIERLIQSLIACYKKEHVNLNLPVLMELQYHRYE